MVTIGDTGEEELSSIDFSPGAILYGNAGGRLVEIDITDASVTRVGGGGFGPDRLEPKPKDNRIRNNWLQTENGDNLRIPARITLPTALRTELSVESVAITSRAGQHRYGKPAVSR